MEKKNPIGLAFLLLLSLVGTAGADSALDLPCFILLQDVSSFATQAKIVEYYGKLIEEYRGRLNDEKRFQNWIAEALTSQKYFTPPSTQGGGVLWDYLSSLEGIVTQSEVKEAIRRHLGALLAQGQKIAKNAERVTRATREVLPPIQKLGIESSLSGWTFLNPDGRYLIYSPKSGTSSSGAAIYDLQENRIVHRRKKSLWSVHFERDGERVTFLEDGSTKSRWITLSLKTGQEIVTRIPREIAKALKKGERGRVQSFFDGSSDRVFVVLLASANQWENPPPGLVGDEETARGFLWDRAKGKVYPSVPLSKGCGEISFHPERPEIVGLDTDDVLFYADLEKGRIGGRQAGVADFNMSWENKRIYALTEEHEFWVQDLDRFAQGEWKGRRIFTESDSLMSFAVDEKRNEAIYRLEGGKVMKWVNLEDGRELGKIHVNPSQTRGFHVAPDFRKVLLPGSREVMIWDLETGAVETLKNFYLAYANPDFRSAVMLDPQGGVYRLNPILYLQR